MACFMLVSDFHEMRLLHEFFQPCSFRRSPNPAGATSPSLGASKTELLHWRGGGGDEDNLRTLCSSQPFQDPRSFTLTKLKSEGSMKAAYRMLFSPCAASFH